MVVVVVAAVAAVVAVISKSLRQYLSNIPGKHAIKGGGEKHPYCALHT